MTTMKPHLTAARGSSTDSHHGCLLAVRQPALRAGRMLLIIDTDGAAEMTGQAVAAMTRWRVDGLILAADHHRPVEVPPGITAAETILVNCVAPARQQPQITTPATSR